MHLRTISTTYSDREELLDTRTGDRLIEVTGGYVVIHRNGKVDRTHIVRSWRNWH